MHLDQGFILTGHITLQYAVYLGFIHKYSTESLHGVYGLNVQAHGFRQLFRSNKPAPTVRQEIGSIKYLPHVGNEDLLLQASAYLGGI